MNIYNKIRNLFKRNKKKIFVVKKIWYVEARNPKEAILKVENKEHKILEISIDMEGVCDVEQDENNE